MLLLGVDARERWAADDVRSDSIIILHIPATHDQAYLISIPRDTEAQIPAFKKSGYAGGTDKINAAFQAGAAQRWRLGGRRPADGPDDQAADRDQLRRRGDHQLRWLQERHRRPGHGADLRRASEVKSLHMSYVDGKPMWNADAKKTGKRDDPGGAQEGLPGDGGLGGARLLPAALRPARTATTTGSRTSSS